MQWQRERTQLTDRWRTRLRAVLYVVTVLAIIAIAGAGIGTMLRRQAPEGKPPAPEQESNPQGPRSLTQTLLGLYLTLRQSEIYQPAIAGDDRQIDFEIALGETAGTIGPRLESAGLIRSADLFTALVRYRGVDHALEAGEYRLSPGMTLDEIVGALQHGRARMTTVTIPEGWRMEQVAARLAEAGLGDEEEFLALMRSPDYDYPWLTERPIGAPQDLEGFLFPDTYNIPQGTSPAAVIEMMLHNFDRRVTPELRLAMIGQGMSFYEGLALAAIVEREAVKASERSTIAAVFLERLEIGMYLQADPTVSYAKGFDAGLGRWWTPMYEEDAQDVDSPYNTFLNGGLPPGPICSPGLSSIEAVAYPANTSYLFFVAKGDGSHAFAETFEEHLANMARYQGQ